MSELHLLETVHPCPEAQVAYDALIGLDEHKTLLLGELISLLDPERLKAWERKHHPHGLELTRRWMHASRLILLSGDVGCGKSALANAVGTPLAKAIGKRVVTLETPSDLRGWGHVGEMSARITDAFGQARRRAKDVGAGILVIDEADDVATARAQMQAHHEDRAGSNVLIKQIDQLVRTNDPLVTLLVTNRHAVLDPAVRRRTSLHLSFTRPDAAAREKLFQHILDGVATTPDQLRELAQATEPRGAARVSFSYSDLADRLARAVLREAQRRDVRVSVELVLDCLRSLEPSPPMEGQ